MGDRSMSSGYTKKVEHFDKFPLLGYTTELGGGESIHYCDYYWSGGTVLSVGGRWSVGSFCGLWYWDGSSSASYAYSAFGGRLCYKPL